jgi:adenylate cyclase
LAPRPYRRGFFAPKLTGVPEDLKILRLVPQR